MKKLILSALGVAAMASGANAAGVGEMNDPTAQVVAPATFEDLGLAPDSYWRGDVEDEDYDFGSFRSGDFEFPNFYMAEYGTWAWYAYSSVTANNGTTWVDQFQSAPGGGHDSATFGVAYVDAYMGPADILVYGPEEGSVLEGMWVTNGAWTRHCILNGDGMSGPFEKGDYLKVIVTGFDADDVVTGSTEFYLADYRSENEADHYALDTWEWMDLSGAGLLDHFQISMETTKVNDWGPTTPMYVCIDDVNTSSTYTSGITRPAAELGQRTVRIHTLDGRLVGTAADFRTVHDLTPGLYILTDGLKSKKIMVK